LQVLPQEVYEKYLQESGNVNVYSADYAVVPIERNE